MQPYITLNDDLPTTLAELEKRLKMNRGRKGLLWMQIARQMTEHFGMMFTSKHVARKWFTLVDGYKKEAILQNASTGCGPSRFRWMTEMSGRHDVSFVVTGTQDGVTVHRPDELSDSVGDGEPEHEEQGTKGKTDNKPRKRKVTDGSSSNMEEVLKYMRESDKKANLFQQQVLSNLGEITNSMKSVIGKLIDKM